MSDSRDGLATILMGAGALAVIVLSADHVVSVRRVVFGRIEARAEALAETVAESVIPALRRADAAAARRAASVFSRMDGVERLIVSDRAGNVVFAAAEGDAPTIDAERRIRGGDGSLGKVRVSLSTAQAASTVRTLAWRTAALGSATAVILLFSGWALDRRRRHDAVLRDDWAQMLVHDLKHPLMVLQVALAGLERREVPEAKKETLMDAARRALDRQEGMIEELLQIGKLEAGPAVQPRVLPLSSFLKRFAEDLVQNERPGRRLRVHVEPELALASVWADPVLLRRVLANLVTNSIENSPPGTEIVLGAARISGLDEQAELYVADRGPGLAAPIAARLGRRYASTAESARNVGLGLAFCRLAAERHGSRLVYRPREGGGSVFALKLPMVRHSEVTS